MNTELIKKGYVHVYTGESKGKTTAALGLVLRATGRGLKTYIGQFLKGRYYGELNAINMLKPYVTIEQFGDEKFYQKKFPDEKAINMAKRGLQKGKKAMLSGEYDLVVFDEINVANLFGLVTVKDMLDIISEKPNGVEVVFTGRYAPKEIIAASDLVTEMKEIKHYYKKGVVARKGIEL